MLNLGQYAAIFRELLTVKPHELLIIDQIWIDVKATFARPFSCRGLALPTQCSERRV